MPNRLTKAVLAAALLAADFASVPAEFANDLVSTILNIRAQGEAHQ